MPKRQCDNIGIEPWICLWRGEETDCLKPKNKIPYDYGFCPHMVPLNKTEGGMFFTQVLRKVEDEGTLGID